MSLEKCNSYKIYNVFDVFFFLILLEWKEKASSNENWCNRRPCSCVCKLYGRNAVQLLGETAGNCAYTLHIDAVQRTALASLMRQNTTLSSFLRFLFNVYLSSFRRKVSKYVTVFGQRSFSFDFLRNKVSLQSIVENLCMIKFVTTFDGNTNETYFQIVDFVYSIGNRN